MTAQTLLMPDTSRKEASLRDVIDNVLSSEQGQSDRAQALFEFLVDLTNAEGAVLVRFAGGDEPLAIVGQPPDFAQVHASAMELATIAAEMNTVQLARKQSPADRIAQRYIAVPLNSEQSELQWVAVIMMAASADQFLQALTLERAELAAGLARACDRRQPTDVDATAPGHAIKKLLFEPAWRDEMLAELCRHWERETKAERVVFGIVEGPRVKTLVSSDDQAKLASTTLGASLIDAMEKAIDREGGAASERSLADVERPEFNCLMENLSDRSHLIYPLRWDGSIKAIILAEYRGSHAKGGAKRLQQELSENLDGLAFRLRTERNTPLPSLSKHLKKRKTKLEAAALVGIALLGFMPIDHQVRSPFVIAPQDKRIVVSPQEGVLRAVGVRPGDQVTSGQTILAELETTNVDLELTAVQARHAEAMTTADLARAADIPGQAQAALLQAEAAQAQIDLLNYRRSLATIRAPQNGVVLKGETEKLLGSVVPQGQTLFEIGSVDAMKVELSVPDHKIDYVRKGGKGQLSTSARPNESTPFQVERIYPVAEVREGQNVFRVVGKLTSSTAGPSPLKPGMEGIAWIQAGRRSLASALFGDLLDGLRMKFWL